MLFVTSVDVIHLVVMAKNQIQFLGILNTGSFFAFSAYQVNNARRRNSYDRTLNVKKLKNVWLDIDRCNLNGSNDQIWVW